MKVATDKVNRKNLVKYHALKKYQNDAHLAIKTIITKHLCTEFLKH